MWAPEMQSKSKFTSYFMVYEILFTPWRLKTNKKTTKVRAPLQPFGQESNASLSK